VYDACLRDANGKLPAKGNIPAKAKEFVTVASALTFLHDGIDFLEKELFPIVRAGTDKRTAATLLARTRGTFGGVTSILRNRHTYIKVTESGDVDAPARKVVDRELYGSLLFGNYDEGGDLVDFIEGQRSAVNAQVAVQAAKATASRLVGRAGRSGASSGEEGAAGQGSKKKKKTGDRRGGKAARDKRERGRSKSRARSDKSE
jgi:hypothetical protein